MDIQRMKWTQDKARSLIRQGLLAFVLITIGFAFGKESERRRNVQSATALNENGAAATTRETQDTSAQLRVYYTHGKTRCVTCNRIENMARETVETEFADPLKLGKVEWRVVNFEEDEAFAEHYGIFSSTVVVASIKGGNEVSFDRLDEVWTKFDDPDGFGEYIAAHIKKHLLTSETSWQ